MNRPRLALVLTLIALPAGAQNFTAPPAPATRAFNHWVTSQRSLDLIEHPLSFLYLDEQAGFTVHLSGSFSVDKDGRCHQIPNDTLDKKKMTLKARVENNVPFLVLSDKCLAELELPARPDWMKFYDDGKNSVEHRVHTGFWLNHLGDPEAALVPLESAYKENAAVPQVAFELGFADNALERFDRAAPLLAEALRRDPKALDVGSELAYALMGSGKTAEAVERYLATIVICPETDKELKSEMAMNLGHCYQLLGDDANVQTWSANTKAWAPKGSAVWKMFNAPS